MTDREKVIEELERLSEWLFHQYQVVYDGDAPNYYDAYKTVDDAIALLKEQEPEEPLIILKKRVEEVYDYLAECPKCCMEWAMWHSEKMRYCPGCGRKVKWNE